MMEYLMLHGEALTIGFLAGATLMLIALGAWGCWLNAQNPVSHDHTPTAKPDCRYCR